MFYKTNDPNEITYTLSEISSTCKKAARGMDLSWGMAEEAGMVAKVLSKFRMDGCGLLAHYFKWREENADQLQDNTHCPLVIGTIICDRQSELAHEGFQFEAVRVPALLFSPLYLLAKMSGQNLKFSFDDHSCLISYEGISYLDEDAEKTLWDEAKTIKIEPTDEQFVASYVQLNNGMSVNGEVWAYLSQLAHKTYAPESEASRLSGAGAGLQDND